MLRTTLSSKLAMVMSLSALPFVVSCGDRGGGSSTASATATATTKTTAAATAKATATAAASVSAAAPSAAPSAPPSAAPAGASLSAEEFCAQAIKLGDDNMAKCADSEKA